jgi:hypothetical protein
MQIAQEIRVKINKWDFIKLTRLCKTKEAINRAMRQTTK